jgi:hypothetical protein
MMCRLVNEVQNLAKLSGESGIYTEVSIYSEALHPFVKLYAILYNTV